jgi:hypothetical protein
MLGKEGHKNFGSETLKERDFFENPDAEKIVLKLVSTKLDMTVWNGFVWLRFSNPRHQNVVMSTAGLGPENDCAGKDQQQL